MVDLQIATLETSPQSHREHRENPYKTLRSQCRSGKDRNLG